MKNVLLKKIKECRSRDNERAMNNSLNNNADGDNSLGIVIETNLPLTTEESEVFESLSTDNGIDDMSESGRNTSKKKCLADAKRYEHIEYQNSLINA